MYSYPCLLRDISPAYTWSLLKIRTAEANSRIIINRILKFTPEKRYLPIELAHISQNPSKSPSSSWNWPLRHANTGRSLGTAPAVSLILIVLYHSIRDVLLIRNSD